MSECPSFWCSRCLKHHADECPPATRDMPKAVFKSEVGVSLPAMPSVGSMWVGEWSDDNGVTWRPNNWEYEVLGADPQTGIAQVRMRDTRLTGFHWMNGDKHVNAWGSKGTPAPPRNSHFNPAPHRLLRLRPRP